MAAEIRRPDCSLPVEILVVQKQPLACSMISKTLQLQVLGLGIDRWYCCKDSSTYVFVLLPLKLLLIRNDQCSGISGFDHVR